MSNYNFYEPSVSSLGFKLSPQERRLSASGLSGRLPEQVMMEKERYAGLSLIEQRLAYQKKQEETASKYRK